MILSLQGVSKSFRGPSGLTVNVLQEVDLDFREGDYVVVTGPSGSGKTTLLHLCALLDRPTTGNILFDGVSVDYL